MPKGFNNTPPAGQGLLDNVVGGNISGILSTRPSAKYASGARCILKINGEIIGFAFGISWRITTAVSEINTIDDPFTNELVPQRCTVDGSISALHIPGVSAGTKGWQANALSFLFQKYIQIEVRDSKTDEVLFLASKAMITSRQEELRVDQLANVTLSFKAIGWRDELPPTIPENYKDPNPQSESTTNLPASLVPDRLRNNA